MKSLSVAVPLFLALLVVFFVTIHPPASHAAVMSSGSYRMVADVLSGGGGDSTSASYVLRETVGQPSAIGPSQSTTYDNYAGFWYSAIMAEMKRPSYIAPLMLLLLGD